MRRDEPGSAGFQPAPARIDRPRPLAGWKPALPAQGYFCGIAKKGFSGAAGYSSSVKPIAALSSHPVSCLEQGRRSL